MSLLTDVLTYLNIDFDEEMTEKISDFYQLLVEKNKVMNLTSITEYDDFVIRHLCDSLLSCRIHGFCNQSLIDVGTGAGFPGIPLKIFFPSLEIVLLDSLNKRLLFLDEVIEKLDLKNIHTVHGRAEDLGKDPLYREKFDLVVSRAVASLNVLSELTVPFAKKDGKVIYYKSSDIDDELASSLKAFDILGGSTPSVFDVPLFDTGIIRKFVVIDKLSSTPKMYPRKAGTPSKNPII